MTGRVFSGHNVFNAHHNARQHNQRVTNPNICQPMVDSPTRRVVMENNQARGGRSTANTSIKLEEPPKWRNQIEGQSSQKKPNHGINTPNASRQTTKSAIGTDHVEKLILRIIYIRFASIQPVTVPRAISSFSASLPPA